MRKIILQSQNERRCKMKKVLILAVALVLVATGISFADIANSKHDLTTGGGYSGATMSACQYCHTPHLRTNPAVTGAPLWNRTLGTDGSWTMYGGGSTLAGTTINTNPGPNSRTCLSCHDGSVAVGTVLVGNADTITKATVLDATGLIISNANLGTDLSNEHPIGFTVDDTQAGLDTLANMKTAGFKFYGGGANEMECASCHDPHNTTNTPFLRVSGASICTDCHVSK